MPQVTPAAAPKATTESATARAKSRASSSSSGEATPFQKVLGNAARQKPEASAPAPKTPPTKAERKPAANAKKVADGAKEDAEVDGKTEDGEPVPATRDSTSDESEGGEKQGESHGHKGRVPAEAKGEKTATDPGTAQAIAAALPVDFVEVGGAPAGEEQGGAEKGKNAKTLGAAPTHAKHARASAGNAGKAERLDAQVRAGEGQSALGAIAIPGDLDFDVQEQSVGDRPSVATEVAPPTNTDVRATETLSAQPVPARETSVDRGFHAKLDAAQAPPEAQFSEVNHPKIVTAVHGQLLPAGGTMHLRLDPPELGALHLRVEMRDGVMTASFQTSNEQATRLLSHSLGDLKSALEAQGVSVDKLHVHQGGDRPTSDGGQGQREPDRDREQAARQEQQRREMLQRMWRKLSGGSDPLDLVA